jgi:hypothetical protein
MNHPSLINLQDVLDALPFDPADVSFCRPDWVDLNDIRTLYRAAIVALLENAEDDGFELHNMANGLPVQANSVDVVADDCDSHTVLRFSPTTGA